MSCIQLVMYTAVIYTAGIGGRVGYNSTLPPRALNGITSSSPFLPNNLVQCFRPRLTQGHLVNFMADQEFVGLPSSSQTL